MKTQPDTVVNKGTGVSSPETLQNSLFPQKLSHKSYDPATPSDDKAVNDIVNSMEAELDQIIQSNQPKTRKAQNLTPEEKAGLKWLNNKVDSNQIAVVQADKGGSILLVDPEMLHRRTLQKLEDPQLYHKLKKDPVADLHKDLFNLWVEGKENSFVTPEEARYVMGISSNKKKDSNEMSSQPTNRPSTASRFKPGKSFFTHLSKSIKWPKMT